MKRELGIARCGLACCLCTEDCGGCNSGDCPETGSCENRACSIQRGYAHCYECDENCRKGWFFRLKPYAFTQFAKRYGEEELLNCLERNERSGVVYHRDGFYGDYDEFDDVEALIAFIRTGKRNTDGNTGEESQ